MSNYIFIELRALRKMNDCDYMEGRDRAMSIRVVISLISWVCDNLIHGRVACLRKHAWPLINSSSIRSCYVTFFPHNQIKFDI